MAYFQIVVDTSYCGTGVEDYIECETVQEAQSIAEELCKNNAENYEYLISGWGDQNFEGMTEEERTEELEEYYTSYYWYVKEISAEEYFANIS